MRTLVNTQHLLVSVMVVFIFGLIILSVISAHAQCASDDLVCLNTHS